MAQIDTAHCRLEVGLEISDPSHGLHPLIRLHFGTCSSKRGCSGKQAQSWTTSNPRDDNIDRLYFFVFCLYFLFSSATLVKKRPDRQDPPQSGGSLGSSLQSPMQVHGPLAPKRATKTPSLLPFSALLPTRRHLSPHPPPSPPPSGPPL